MPDWSGETYALMTVMIGVAAIIITVVIFSINLRLNAQDKTIEAYESKVESKFDVLQAQMSSVKETVLAGAEEHKEFRQSILQVNQRIDRTMAFIMDRDSKAKD